MKKVMMMALMALVCMTASAKQGKKQQQDCDTAKCCQKCPVPGVENLSDEDKAKLKEIFERYMSEVKAVCPAKEDTACARPQGPRPEGPRPEGDVRPGGPDQKGGPQECCKAPQLTDEEADAQIQAELEAKGKIIAIQQKYYSEFRTILSPQQVKAVYSMQCRKGGGQQPRQGQRHEGPGAPGQPGPGQPQGPTPAAE